MRALQGSSQFSVVNEVHSRSRLELFPSAACRGSQWVRHSWERGECQPASLGAQRVQFASVAYQLEGVRGDPRWPEYRRETMKPAWIRFHFGNAGNGTMPPPPPPGSVVCCPWCDPRCRCATWVLDVRTARGVRFLLLSMIWFTVHFPGVARFVLLPAQVACAIRGPAFSFHIPTPGDGFHHKIKRLKQIPKACKRANARFVAYKCYDAHSAAQV